ncbi:hypothetical protein VNO78_15563 [Psophocarpus tetragonolobus]|uniref:Uncharacterized protein n=1 Tax=Psophocarpus tetragonolobus TaxID=3891 RepID=A0AAN9XJA5_PSOTE
MPTLGAPSSLSALGTPSTRVHDLVYHSFATTLSSPLESFLLETLTQRGPQTFPSRLGNLSVGVWFSLGDVYSYSILSLGDAHFWAQIISLCLKDFFSCSLVTICSIISAIVPPIMFESDFGTVTGTADSAKEWLAFRLDGTENMWMQPIDLAFHSTRTLIMIWTKKVGMVALDSVVMGISLASTMSNSGAPE